MSFTDAFENKVIEKETENGAFAYKTTKSAVMDLYGVVGAMRSRDDADIVDMFNKAYAEDKNLAERIVLYARNIREAGLGERRVGKVLLKALLEKDADLIRRNFKTIVDNGRWDDLFVFFDTEVEKEMLFFVEGHFKRDFACVKEGKSISQLAKWLPSINGGKKSRVLAKKVAKFFGFSEPEYRKTLSTMREYLDITERKMCSNEWGLIDYKKVPSVCMNRNGVNFGVHDNERYTKYLEDVKNGVTKVNASVLYPYDIIGKFPLSCYGGCDENDHTLEEEQWKAMPNYFTKGFNVITMADVSGSMAGRPMDTSVGMAIYCAQHNEGAYKNKFMTFTDKPHFFTISEGASLKDTLSEVCSPSNVGYSTNLDGALQSVYELAVESNDSPDALLIVSDCEIDKFCCDFDKFGKDIVEKYEHKFNEANIKMPILVFWQVAARQNTFLGKASHPNVRFISGQSASNFTNLETIIKKSNYDAMVEVLSKYSWM